MVSIVGDLSCVRVYSRLLVVLYHVHVSFADADVGFNLLCGKYRRY